MRFVSFADRALSLCATAMSALGALTIFGLMLLIVADVVGRSLLSMPIVGVPEIAKMSIVAIVFLHLPGAFPAGRVTQVQFFPSYLERSASRLARVLAGVIQLSTALVFALIAWITWDRMIEAYAGGYYVGNVGVFTLAEWPFRAVVLISSVVLVTGRCVAAAKELERRVPAHPATEGAQNGRA